jgi:hypothetical protein
MPTYTFRNTETDEELEVCMKMSEREYLEITRTSSADLHGSSPQVQQCEKPDDVSVISFETSRRERAEELTSNI